jgi:prepilin-type N-terminal cleavage/methylation domain-containing protein
MKGFTLVELIIVLGIIILVSAMSLPFVSTFQVTSDLRTYNDGLAQAMRTAQFRAIDGYQGTNWGVYLDNAGKKYVIYSGNNYAARVTDSDLETGFNSAFSLTANFGNDINFTIYNGLPSVNGTTTFTGTTDVTRYVTISSLGLIYGK